MGSRSITQIHQIEVTTKCNLHCRYCPHGKMTRKKEHMSMETYESAIKWVEYFDSQGTQTEVSLTGIGEPLMHPRFLEMVGMLRDVYDGPILFSTNGSCEVSWHSFTENGSLLLEPELLELQRSSVFRDGSHHVVRESFLILCRYLKDNLKIRVE